MVPDPPSSPPAGRPSAGTSRKPSFALGGFPPSTPLAVDQQDPFSFRQPQPVETPYANPWQNLFAQSGAPTPSVLPPDSPFAPVNAVGFGFPADGGAGAGGGARRGSLGHPGVASGFSNLSIGSPHRQGTHSHPSLAQSDSQRSMGPPPPMQPPQQWPTSTSPPQLSLPPSKPSFAHPTLNKDANGHMMGGPIGGTGRRAGPVLSSTSKLKAVHPIQLPTPIPATHLILDLRTHHLFTQSRIPSAVPITIPSTLLRRPNFTIAKVLPMLASDHDRNRLSAAFRPGEIDTIVVYDQDGLTSQEGGVLQGLLNKFDKEGFKGELCYVKGGFVAVVKAGVEGLVESTPPAQTARGGAVNGRDLPIEAFQQGSVNAFGGRQTGTDIKMGSRSGNSQAGTASTTRPPGAGPGSQSTPATQTQAANPFFDNIRQNAELGQGITERIPLDLPESTVQRSGDLPRWLRELVTASPAEASEILAMQFYKIELGEQRRLQGIMDHHTRHPGDATMESGSDSDGVKRGGSTPGGTRGERQVISENGGDYFPYSITAGLEKGGKNRFKNIWPFDHARVRLNEPCVDDGSDYINASYIQPRATNKRYIATQGPLPSTYRDFWTLCWEQNVRVIVMLTKQHEGGQIKCGDYWSDQTYGPMKLHPIGTEGGVDEAPQSDGGGFFFGAPKPAAAPAAGARATIKRSFHLSHADHADEPPRLVTQIQYVSWPDFDIPETPSDLLHLIRDVNELNDSAVADAHENGSKGPGPIVVHCSAGVGRTGSYVIVDAVLDAMKREMLGKREVLTKRSFDRRAAGASALSVASDGSTQQKPPVRSQMAAPPVFGQQTATSPMPISGSIGGSAGFPGMAPRTSSSESDETQSTGGSGTSVRSARPSALNQQNLSLPPVFQGTALSPEPDSSFFNSSAQAVHPNSTSPNPPAFNFNDINIHNRSRTASHSSSLAGGGPLSAHPSASDLSVITNATTSTATSSHGYSREPSPVDSERHASSTEDGFAAPRKQQRGNVPDKDVGAPTPLAEMNEPIRAILEDMRQQRMSLCQTLRQYVFAYRVVIQGILDMVDDDRGRDSSHDLQDEHKKRQASPTDLQSTLSKRPSIKLPKVRPRRVSATPSTHPLNTTSSPASSAAATGDLDPIPGSAVSETGPILGARVD